MSLRRSASLPLVVIALTLGLVMSTTAQSPAVRPGAPTSAPRPSPGTETSPGGLGWVPIAIDLPDDHWLTDLTAWAGGFAALESDDDDDMYALWTSPDGTTWERSPLPDGADGDRLVALGDHVYLQEFRGRGESQELRIRTWRTSDGRQWEDQGLFEWQLPAFVGDDWRIVSRFVIAAPDRLVMLGGVEPCCGTGGSVPFVSKYASILTAADREHVPLGGLVIWTSADGKRWTRQSNRDLRDPRSGDNAWLLDVEGVADGILATSATADALYASSDGDEWRTMGPLPPGYRGSLGSHGLVTVDGQVVVSFDIEGTNAIEVWLREEPGAWTRSLHEPWTAISALIAAGRLVVAAGPSHDNVHEDWPRILVSTDGGATWDPELSWSGARGGCARDLATDGTRLVLFGCDDGGPTLWHADVPARG